MEIFDIAVNVEMIPQVSSGAKVLQAQVALVLLIVCIMAFHVCFEITRKFKVLLANGTDEFLFGRFIQVALQMIVHRFGVVELQVANLARSGMQKILCYGKVSF